MPEADRRREHGGATAVKVLRRPGGGKAPEPLAERGRRRRLAVVVPAVAVACGLVAGGLAGEWVVSQRRTVSRAKPVDAGPLAGRATGPIEQLLGAGTLLFADQQGRVVAQAADGRDRQTLGQLSELAARPRQQLLDLELAASRLAAPADDRPAELAADGDQVYLLLADGAAAVGRVLDGSVRRLVPAGWRSPVVPRHSADGSVLGVCGYRPASQPLPAVAAARSWVVDGSGNTLATLPGCLYDLSADGGQALVADPAQGRLAGPVPDWRSGRAPPVGGSDQLTRGLRLWRRGQPRFSPVLGFAEVTRVFRTVQPGVDPRGLVIVTAALGPDGRQAMVRIVDALADAGPRTGKETEVLALVDLERGRAEAIPEHLPGYVAFLPTGGYVYTGATGTATYVPRGRPPRLLQSGIAADDLYAVVPSPDGAWVLLAGASWRFIRVDDPSVQVSYPAPGRLTAWTPAVEAAP